MATESNTLKDVLKRHGIDNASEFLVSDKGKEKPKGTGNYRIESAPIRTGQIGRDFQI